MSLFCVKFGFEDLQLRFVATDAAVDGVDVATYATDHALLVGDLAVDDLQGGQSRRNTLAGGGELAGVFVHLSLQIGFFALQLADAGGVGHCGGQLLCAMGRRPTRGSRLLALVFRLGGQRGGGFLNASGFFAMSNGGLSGRFGRFLSPFDATVTSRSRLFLSGLRGNGMTKGKKQ